MENNHIVYAAFDTNGNCMYVGEGKPDRYKHITSGVSHVYEANKWHFARRKLRVDILAEGLTKAEAMKLEQKKIEELTPAWNKAEHATMTLLSMCNFVTKEIKKFVKNTRYENSANKHIQIAKDMCKLMNNDGNTTITRGQSWCSIKLPSGFMAHLAAENYEYYPVLRSVFTVNSKNGVYHIQLKGWGNPYKIDV